MPKIRTNLIITCQVLVASSILVFSCKKDKNTELLITPPTTSQFVLRDTLNIEQQYSTGPFAEVYNRYNGKVYSFNSINKVAFSLQEAASNISFTFSDSSVINLVPSFTIILKNTGLESLAPEYNLANNEAVSVKYGQTFMDGSSSIVTATKVKSGVLKIMYNSSQKTVSGEINELKVPLGYFASENIPIFSRSSNGVLIEKGGSTRTISLKFADVKTN